MIYFEDATKKQLIHICLYEECSLDEKYEAARELQIRQWRDDYLIDLLRLWGQNKSIFEIAIEMGLEKGQIEWKLEKLGLYGKRVGV